MTSTPTPGTASTAPATVRTRHRRGPLVAIAVVLALFGAACTPSPDDPGSIDIPFGPITVPLPPIGAVPPPVTVDLILCQVERRPPKLDLDVYPYLPRADVAKTSAASYMCLVSAGAR